MLIFYLLLLASAAHANSKEQPECTANEKTCELAGDPVKLSQCCQDNHHLGHRSCRALGRIGYESQLPKVPESLDTVEGLRGEVESMRRKVNAILDQGLAGQCCQEEDSQKMCQSLNLGTFKELVSPNAVVDATFDAGEVQVIRSLAETINSLVDNLRSQSCCRRNGDHSSRSMCGVLDTMGHHNNLVTRAIGLEAAAYTAGAAELLRAVVEGARGLLSAADYRQCYLPLQDERITAFCSAVHTIQGFQSYDYSVALDATYGPEEALQLNWARSTVNGVIQAFSYSQCCDPAYPEPQVENLCQAVQSVGSLYRQSTYEAVGAAFDASVLLVINNAVRNADDLVGWARKRQCCVDSSAWSGELSWTCHTMSLLAHKSPASLSDSPIQSESYDQDVRDTLNSYIQWVEEIKDFAQANRCQEDPQLSHPKLLVTCDILDALATLPSITVSAAPATFDNDAVTIVEEMRLVSNAIPSIFSGNKCCHLDNDRDSLCAVLGHLDTVYQPDASVEVSDTVFSPNVVADVYSVVLGVVVNAAASPCCRRGDAAAATRTDEACLAFRALGGVAPPFYFYGSQYDAPARAHVVDLRAKLNAIVSAADAGRCPGAGSGPAGKACDVIDALGDVNEMDENVAVPGVYGPEAAGVLRELLAMASRVAGAVKGTLCRADRG